MRLRRRIRPIPSRLNCLFQGQALEAYSGRADLNAIESLRRPIGVIKRHQSADAGPRRRQVAPGGIHQVGSKSQLIGAGIMRRETHFEDQPGNSHTKNKPRSGVNRMGAGNASSPCRGGRDARCGSCVAGTAHRKARLKNPQIGCPPSPPGLFFGSSNHYCVKPSETRKPTGGEP